MLDWWISNTKQHDIVVDWETMSLPDARVNKNLEGPGVRARVQRFGSFLAGMIMPNIGAFIAWGLITALFIEKGWLPNADLAALVGPMINFLLPVLIGYTGGRMVHGQRGAVIGAIATMGVAVGANTPMFLGAMIAGPSAAWLLKQFDKLIEGRVRSGFEMLVDNFSLGILGTLLAAAFRLAIGPVVNYLVVQVGVGVQWLVTAGMLPFASIFVEPAKILFLNNAINHGVLSPLGAAQSLTGKSILFMVESNPGPGLGLLLAFAFFGPKTLRGSTPGAIVIHFLGGIHEIYFPYVLMKPKMVLATIAGGMAGVATATLLGAGLVSSPAPGSIFAYLIVTPRGGYFAMIATVAMAAGVAFVVGAALLGFGKDADPVAGEMTESISKTHPLVEATATPQGLAAFGSDVPSHPAVNGRDIRTLIVACDAGMGSSAMVASQLKKKLSPHKVEVVHCPIAEIPASAQVVMCQSGLAERARLVNPAAVIVRFEQFIGDPAFTRIENAIRNGETIE